MSKPIGVSAQANPGSPLSWGSRHSGPHSWMVSEFQQPGSSAELTSSFLSSQRGGPAPVEDVQGLLRAEMDGKHSASRASACSIVSDHLVEQGRGSAAEVTTLVVNELNEAMEQQLWRQQSVAGSVVVFVTAGYEGKRFVFEIAYQMELTVVIIDDEGSWSQQLVEEGLAERFIPLNIEDLDASFDECVALIQGVRDDLGRLDAVLSFCELAQPLVARLTTHFKLPGNSVESVLAARDKHLSREAFLRAGLPTPNFFLITEEAHCEEAAAHVGFPAVIKPILGAASIGVMRVNSLTELWKGVQEVRSQLLHARVVHGALQEGTPEFDRQGSNAGAWIQLSIMMEEYLDGPEVDIDVAILDGVSYYEAITDNWPTIEPYFNETGSNCPSLLPADQQRELRNLAVASIKALGLTTGVCHVEAKYTSRGPRLIEVNCRMGGGPVQLINRLVYGVDLAAEQLIFSCGGEPFERIENREPLCNIAEYSMNSPRTGFILHTNFLANWQGHPRLLYARPLVHPRQRVIGPADGMPTWLCEVMCTAPSVEEGIQFVKDIEKSVEFPIMDELPPEDEQP
eukprot:GGOE01014130.1.p1 GENE.GGOE01014130.1~~GGOE01014130.1.p1  ORF type:complete len:597 (+),score=110.91 GGOE01014130.1:83-1792(+)